ncbi:MAG: hypothetical protein WCV55_02880 [Candidatus Paceibacterota bacterium]
MKKIIAQIKILPNSIKGLLIGIIVLVIAVFSIFFDSQIIGELLWWKLGQPIARFYISISEYLDPGAWYPMAELPVVFITLAIGYPLVGYLIGRVFDSKKISKVFKIILAILLLLLLGYVIRYFIDN